ncbi:MAG: amidohydrolase [Thermodesulfobacteriota bacterium]|nr:amidohydrolase [Thermodesulfobacteriota bacterium]
MQQVDIIVFGGLVVCMDEKGSVLDRGAIAIKGDTIVDIGPSDDIRARYTALTDYDATGFLVMPGLVNGHTHSPMTFFRGLADDLPLMDWLNNYIFPAEKRFVDPEFSYNGTLLACAEMIRSGTTTFCDMYIFEKEVIEAARKTGMRCMAGEVLFDFPSPNVSGMDEGLSYMKDLIERYADDPLVDIIAEPHSLYTCSGEVLTGIRDMSHRYGIPIGLHLLETEQERNQLVEKFGKSPIVYLDENGYLDQHFIAFHGVWLDDEEIETLASRGAGIVHNPESNMKLASGIAPVPQMHEKGLLVGLGTDGCASNNNLDMFEEMDMAAKLHKGSLLDPVVMDAQKVVQMATIEGAKCLGIDEKTGSIEKGKKADIIMIDLDKPHLTPMYNPYSHLVYAVNGSDVDTVIINGKVVMQGRELLTLDCDRIMDQARQKSEEIRGYLDDA